MLKAKPVYTKILSFGCRLCSQFQGPKGRRSKAFLSLLRMALCPTSGKGAFELTRGNGTKLHIEKLPFGKSSRYRSPLTVLLQIPTLLLRPLFCPAFSGQPLNY